MSNKQQPQQVAKQQPQQVAKQQKHQQPQQKKSVVMVFVGTLHQRKIPPPLINRFIFDANVRISNEIRKPCMIIMHDQPLTSIFAQVGSDLISTAVSPAERDVVHHILFDMLTN